MRWALCRRDIARFGEFQQHGADGGIAIAQRNRQLMLGECALYAIIHRRLWSTARSEYVCPQAASGLDYRNVPSLGNRDRYRTKDSASQKRSPRPTWFADRLAVRWRTANMR